MSGHVAFSKSRGNPVRACAPGDGDKIISTLKCTRYKIYFYITHGVPSYISWNSVYFDLSKKRKETGERTAPLGPHLIRFRWNTPLYKFQIDSHMQVMFVSSSSIFAFIMSNPNLTLNSAGKFCYNCQELVIEK